MKSPFAIASLIVPVVIAAFGFLVAIYGPHPSGDWLGMTIILRAGIGLSFAAIVAVVLSGASNVRKEPGRGLSLLFAFPGVLYLGWVALSVVDANRQEAKSEDLMVNYAQFHEQIRKDPSIVLPLNWEAIWDVRRTVLAHAFQESSAPFTLEQLKILHEKYPSIRDHLYAHEACDAEFLASHFQDALTWCRDHNYERLASICSNTNTPIHLLQEIANSKDLPVGAIHPARHTLEKIKREQDGGGQPATRPE